MTKAFWSSSRCRIASAPAPPVSASARGPLTRSSPAFAAGNLLVGLTYACVGALAGALLGSLGATYVVLFLAMLGTGILQNPMFGDGTPSGAAHAFPDYGAGRMVIDGAFSPRLHAWSELALALGWLAALGLGVAWYFGGDCGASPDAVWPALTAPWTSSARGSGQCVELVALMLEQACGDVVHSSLAVGEPHLARGGH